MLTLDLMRRLWPSGNQHVPGLLEGIVAAAPTVFDRYGVTSADVVAIMFGQFSEEAGAGLELVENDNFTADQLLRLWPSHFTGSMAERYAHNPRMICDISYGGRMGNAPPPSDDGYNYRGRGMSQVTGKNGYLALQKELDRAGLAIDIMANPELISDPRYTLWCGVADFVLCGWMPYAEKGDVIGVSSMLNVGHIVPAASINGLASRQSWTRQWRAALASPSLAALSPAPKAPALDPLPQATLRAPSPIPPTSSAEDIVDRIRELLAALK
jgi:putative chitinase